jgi:hypothetical protein
MDRSFFGAAKRASYQQRTTTVAENEQFGQHLTKSLKFTLPAVDAPRFIQDGYVVRNLFRDQLEPTIQRFPMNPRATTATSTSTTTITTETSSTKQWMDQLLDGSIEQVEKWSQEHWDTVWQVLLGLMARIDPLYRQWLSEESTVLQASFFPRMDYGWFQCDLDACAMAVGLLLARVQSYWEMRSILTKRCYFLLCITYYDFFTIL